MTSAVFGVIKIGRCVVRDLGHFGCQSEQQAYLDKKCSGRNKCELPVSDETMIAQTPCAEALIPYLEASFICQKGIVFIVITLANRGGGGGGVQGVRTPPPPLKNNVKGFNPKYKIIS